MAHGNPRVGCHHQSRWCQQWLSRPTMLLCDAPAGCRFSLMLEIQVKPHLYCLKLYLTGAQRIQTGTRRLPCDGTAQLRSVQCIGTRFHTVLLTHTVTLPPFSISLTLTAATTTDAAAAAELFPALLTLDFSGNSFLTALFLLRAALYGADKRWKQIYL